MYKGYMNLLLICHSIFFIVNLNGTDVQSRLSLTICIFIKYYLFIVYRLFIEEEVANLWTVMEPDVGEMNNVCH